MRRYDSYAYSLLRFASGALLFFYGTARLFDWPQSLHTSRYETYFLGPIELVGGLLVAVGLFTRQAACLCAGAMLALFLVHNHSSWQLPILSGSDRTLLFFFAFVYVLCKGGGKLSFDGQRDDHGEK